MGSSLSCNACLYDEKNVFANPYLSPIEALYMNESSELTVDSAVDIPRNSDLKKKPLNTKLFSNEDAVTASTPMTREGSWNHSLFNQRNIRFSN